MTTSNRFELKQEDLKKWGTNALIFLAPALFVLGADAMKAIPAGWQYSVVALYVLNVLLDLLRKFVSEHKYK